MPDNFASWIGLGISIIVFLGAAAVYLRGSKDKGTIATLEKNNEALEARVLILERQDADNKRDNVRLAARVDALERENAVLLGQRPSAEVLEGIDKKLATHDTETRSLLDAILTNVQRESK